MIVFYFLSLLSRCEPDYGIFVPANKVAKAGSGYRGTAEPTKRHNSKPVINHGKVSSSHGWSW